ncbi:hypothetical protein [Rubinisphaera italica]|uniref:Uncharacterized protein n=1 Tax=Rubinisphaera italica TaxID=2527969 RepID=A0A5C5XFY3_9PLAN|nr:hypothetical protein [Rubinisphaera italica]TWT61927.1 hypothetical protein Pan54_26640 [Rubinisphaera italica]
MIIKAQPLPHVARALRGNKRLKILKMTQSGVYCLTDEETYQNLIRQAQENSEAEDQSQPGFETNPDISV